MTITTTAENAWEQLWKSWPLRDGSPIPLRAGQVVTLVDHNDIRWLKNRMPKARPGHQHNRARAMGILLRKTAMGKKFFGGSRLSRSRDSDVGYLYQPEEIKAPRTDAEGWPLRPEFKTLTEWVAAAMRADLRLTTDYPAYQAACQRQRVKEAKWAWKNARSALRKEGHKIPTAKRGRTTEERAQKMYENLSELLEADQVVAIRRAKGIDYLREHPDTTVDEREKLGNLTKTLFNILQRGVRGALGLRIRKPRNDSGEHLKRSRLGWSLTPAETSLVKKGHSIEKALRENSRVDGMGRIVDPGPDVVPEAVFPDAVSSGLVASPNATLEGVAVPKKSDDGVMLRNNFPSTAAWLRALFEEFEGSVTRLDVKALAEEQGFELTDSYFRRGRKNWRLGKGLPPYGDVVPLADRTPHPVNYMPDCIVSEDPVFDQSENCPEPKVDCPESEEQRTCPEVRSETEQPKIVTQTESFIKVTERVEREVILGSADICKLLQHAGVDVPDGAHVTLSEAGVKVRWTTVG